MNSEKINYKVKEELIIEYLDAKIADEAALNAFVRTLKILNISNNIITIKLYNETALNFVKEKYIKQFEDAIENIFEQKKLKLQFVTDNSLKNFNIDQNIKVNSKNLSKKLTLETYVKSKFNAKIIKIIDSTLESPGEYSPIFVYSSSGNGKTHLLHGIGNQFKEKNLSSIYIESNKFVSDVMDFSKKPGELNKFIDSFSKYDVLLFDDINNLGNKNVTMNVLFSIFNKHFDEGKQIIIAADKSPSELVGFTDRLKTRFEAGIIEKIDNPDEEDIEKIIKSKIKHMNLSPEKWEEDAIKFLASNNTSSIRKLEGSIKKVKLYTVNKNNIRYTTTVIKQIFKDLTLKLEDLNANTIISKVSKYYKIPKSKILGKNRTKEVVMVRQMIFYTLRKDLKLPYKEIGKEMNRDHSTVMSGIAKIETSLKNDNTIKIAYQRIKEKIKSYN